MIHVYPNGYNENDLNALLRSSDFVAWLSHFADQKAKARILARITSATFGNFSDCEPVGEGVSEMRIHVGAGSRVIALEQGSTVYVLLAGSVKASQTNGTFDAAAYLENDAVHCGISFGGRRGPNPDVFVAALGDVAKARSIVQIARDQGLGGESLYKTPSAGAHPRLKRSTPSCAPSG